MKGSSRFEWLGKGMEWVELRDCKGEGESENERYYTTYKVSIAWHYNLYCIGH